MGVAQLSLVWQAMGEVGGRSNSWRNIWSISGGGCYAVAFILHNTGGKASRLDEPSAYLWEPSLELSSSWHGG